MKQLVTLVCFVLGTCFAVHAQKASADNGSGGYDIRVKIKGNHDKLRYLGFYYGDKQYLKDTVAVDADGVSEFKGAKPLPGGIYFVMLPSHRYFEILIGQQKFEVETADTTDFVKGMKIKGSPDNDIFLDYQDYITKAGTTLNALNGRYTANKDNKDSLKIIGTQIEKANDAIKDYRLDVIHKHPTSVLAMIFTSMKEPNVPEAPKKADGSPVDSFFAYHYYKGHYWDDMPWGDARILHTPIFHSKMKDYMSKYTSPDPDSVISSCDFILQHAKADSEVFRYCLTYLTHEYETSKIMGYDSIFCHLARVYYIQGRPTWVDSAQMAKLYDRWAKTNFTRLGVYARELNMQDTSGVYHSLYAVNSKYTIVVFWDSQCSHCQHDIPHLDSLYRAVLKPKGIEVYAVNIEAEKGQGTWKKFVKDHKLTWINVGDPHNYTNFRIYYDIYSTPVIYILDKNKRIQAKRIDVDQIMDIISHLDKTPSAAKPTPNTGKSKSSN